HRRVQPGAGSDRAARDGAHALLEAPSRRAGGRRDDVTRYASVFPLVTARALAREFTYEVEDGVEPGAIVSMPFGRRRARGIVVSLGEAPPPGVEARPIDNVVGSVPPALVDLALWV